MYKWRYDEEKLHGEKDRKSGRGVRERSEREREK